MNGQARYELFVKAQQNNNLPVIHLERLVETRWSYWYKSISKINLRYREIIEVLEILSVKDEQKSRALGILKEIKTLTFIKISYGMEQLLKTIHCASKELQDSTIILPVAIDLIKSTRKNLHHLRSDEFWNDISSKALVIAAKNNINVQDNYNKRKLNLNNKLMDYYLETTVGQCSNMARMSSNNDEIKAIFFLAIDR